MGSGRLTVSVVEKERRAIWRGRESGDECGNRAYRLDSCEWRHRKPTSGLSFKFVDAAVEVGELVFRGWTWDAVIGMEASWDVESGRWIVGQSKVRCRRGWTGGAGLVLRGEVRQEGEGPPHRQQTTKANRRNVLESVWFEAAEIAEAVGRAKRPALLVPDLGAPPAACSVS